MTTRCKYRTERQGRLHCGNKDLGSYLRIVKAGECESCNFAQKMIERNKKDPKVKMFVDDIDVDTYNAEVDWEEKNLPKNCDFPF